MTTTTTLDHALDEIQQGFELDGACYTAAEMSHWEYEAQHAAEIYVAEAYAESAWLRHAENASWMEVAAEEYHDMMRGVIY